MTGIKQGKKNENNRIIQSLWIGPKLSTMERLCIESFLQNGHEFHLYAYDDIENVPKTTIIKDASSIIPVRRLFRDSRGTVASFADWFRYQLLYDKGGWWVDMDAVCLKYFDIAEDYCFSTQGYSKHDAALNIGFIKAQARADFLADCLEYIQFRNFQKIQWGEFGPSLFQKIVGSYESDAYIRPPETFCPIYWTEVYKLISLNDYIPASETLAIHLWNEIWRLGYLDKNAVYHPESIYEKLKELYRVL